MANRSYKRWTIEEEIQLFNELKEGNTIQQIAETHERDFIKKNMQRILRVSNS